MRSVTEWKDYWDLKNEITVLPKEDVRPFGPVHVSLVRALADRFGSAHFGRKDFQPSALPPQVLPHLSLLDIEWGDNAEADNTYRYRLFSTGLREVVGQDLAGKEIRDFPKRSCRTYLMRLFDLTAFEGKPLFSTARVEYPTGVNVTTAKSFIPLFGSDEERPNMIMTAFTFIFSQSEHGYIPSLADAEPYTAHEKYRLFDSVAQMADMGMGTTSSGPAHLRIVG